MYNVFCKHPKHVNVRGEASIHNVQTLAGPYRSEDDGGGKGKALQGMNITSSESRSPTTLGDPYTFIPIAGDVFSTTIWEIEVHTCVV